MRLSLSTDFSLRLLMYLAAAEDGVWVTSPEVAELVRAGYLEASQGRAGGVRLAMEPAAIRLGTVVAHLEGSGCLVDCMRGPCPLAGRCILKGVLDGAERGFIAALDRYTLADVVAQPTGRALRALIATQA